MINLIVALAGEARPLVRHFRLSRERDCRGFRVYAAGGMRLIVTGVGKLNAAAGVGYLAGTDRRRDQVWLNIGLGGHRDLEVATGVVAAKITDDGARRSWLPPRIHGMPGRASAVTTFDGPVEDYPPDTVCDMEASAFIGTARRFSAAGLVQSYKVVSDNAATGIVAADASVAEDLIGARLAEIEAICRILQSPA